MKNQITNYKDYTIITEEGTQKGISSVTHFRKYLLMHIMMNLSCQLGNTCMISRILSGGCMKS